MKRILFSMALAIGVSGIALAAVGTDSIIISTDGLTATIAPNGACSGTGCGSLFTILFGSVIEATGSIGNWTIGSVSGKTNSPGLVPTGLDLGVFVTCNAADCSSPSTTLDIKLSDINYNVGKPAGGFTTGYSLTGALTPGTTSESAYFDNGNTLFTETTLIGTVGPLSGTAGGNGVGGAIAAVSKYSLTVDETFTGTCSNFGSPDAVCAAFSTDGNIFPTPSRVPEPTSVILLSSLAVLVGFALRRKLSGNVA